MNIAENKKCILFFVKLPQAKLVKTRLCAELSENFVSELYRSFVEDILIRLQRLAVPVRICYTPKDAGRSVRDWLGEDFEYQAQKGSDLGARMRIAFEAAFEHGFEQVVVMGSDSPDIPEEFIRQSFEMLQECDCVIGPSEDGGYYLIGFRNTGFMAEAFQGIAWSSESVFEQTLAVLDRYRRKVALLPHWYDIDEYSDLQKLIHRNRVGQFKDSNTMNYLRKYGLGV